MKGEIRSVRGRHRFNLMGTEGLSAALSGVLLIPSSWQNKLPAFPVLLQSIFGQQTKLMRHIQCHENPLRAELTFGAILAEMRSSREKNNRATRSCKEKRLPVSCACSGDLELGEYKHFTRYIPRLDLDEAQSVSPAGTPVTPSPPTVLPPPGTLQEF